MGMAKRQDMCSPGVVVAAYVVTHFVYRYRLTRLRDDVAEMSDEERSRFLQEIDPEITGDLKEKDDKSNGEQAGCRQRRDRVSVDNRTPLARRA